MESSDEKSGRLWLVPFVVLGFLLALGLTIASAAPVCPSCAQADQPAAYVASGGGTATPTPCVPVYTYTVSSSIIVTGTSLVPGSQCGACAVNVNLPFPFTFYGQTYTSANLSTQGNLQFLTTHVPLTNTCPLPEPLLGPAIMPHWDNSLETGWHDSCQQYIGSPCGIYTSVTGSAPNRIFNIEWRARFIATSQHTANFEIRLYESTGAIDFVYGWVSYVGGYASIGVQDGAARYTSYACNLWGSVHQGLLVSWSQTPCGPTPTPTQTRTPTPTPTGTPGCGLAWNMVPSPNVAFAANFLNAVAAISPNDIWAVGYHTNVAYDRALILHWDGAQWSIVPSPDPGIAAYLTGISGVAANDVWAVGYMGRGPSQSLILHWDGSAWTQVQAPCSGTCENPRLRAVKAIAANDVWAVGSYASPSMQALLLHWDGSSWSHVGAADPNLRSRDPYAVDAASANDVWAVGYYTNSLALHWDGATWANVPAPNIGALRGVSVLTSSDVWAVGDAGTMHWNGSVWDAVPSPLIPLYAVDAIASDDVWAVGSGIAHWDGAAWTAFPAPLPGGNLRGVAALAPDNVWAVGWYQSGPPSTLIERYFDPCTLPTSTPTPTGTPPTATPTRTPTATATPRPGCCTDVSLVAAAACVPGRYDAYRTDNTFTNNCAVSYTGIRTIFFEVSPSENGPWDLYVQSAPTPRAYPPGDTSETYYFVGNVPTEYQWFRARVTVADQNGCWTREAASAPMRLCRATSVTPTSTPTATPTAPAITRTATPITSPPVPATATRTPSTCVMAFTDVNPTDYFYNAVYGLYCRGIVSGYADDTFRPYNNTTRGQLTKIVTLAEGWPLSTPPAPTFSDVPTTHAFYTYIETAYLHGVISGYGDGTFRPYDNITRGQLTKIVVLAEQWNLYTPPNPTFSDVPASNPFYAYIETAYLRGIISGYADGTFRPYNPATRGQICKIVYTARP